MQPSPQLSYCFFKTWIYNNDLKLLISGKKGFLQWRLAWASVLVQLHQTTSATLAVQADIHGSAVATEAKQNKRQWKSFKPRRLQTKAPSHSSRLRVTCKVRVISRRTSTTTLGHHSALFSCTLQVTCYQQFCSQDTMDPSAVKQK